MKDPTRPAKLSGKGLPWGGDAWRQMVLALIVLGWCQNVFSEAKEGPASDILMAMVRAMRELNYLGTFAYFHGNNVETMRIFHAVYNGIEHERVVSLNSPLRELVRDEGKVVCYFPDVRKVLVERRPAGQSFLINVPEDLSRYARHYDFSLGLGEYVMGRQTRLISILPKDEYRYGRRIWVDRKTSLPLKVELLDDARQRIEVVVFTSLEVKDSLPGEQLEASREYGQYNWQIRTEEPVPAAKQKWTFANIPDGYEMILYTRRRNPNGDADVEHLLLSDGFSSVSVYVDPRGQGGVDGIGKKLGAINLYVRKMGGTQVTVVGEAPSRTVRAIGNGLQRKQAE